jgi:phosphoribosyl-AMP cyclohydrolase
VIRFKFDENGLLPVIIQEKKSKKVLMVAFANRQAVARMLKTGKTCFYSRSRKKLWMKGETSGHVQHVRTLYTDCDRDALLVEVEQKGAACHEGYHSCFYTKLGTRSGKTEKIVARRMFDPKKVYA